MTTENAPKRIQLSRRKGWRKPEGAIVVSRPSKWGNPVRLGYFASVGSDWRRGDHCTMSTYPRTAADLVLFYRRGMHYGGLVLGNGNGGRRAVPLPSHDEVRAALRGKDLACWCALDAPCHADVLLEIANSPAESFGVQSSREGD